MSKGVLLLLMLGGPFMMIGGKNEQKLHVSQLGLKADSKQCMGCKIGKELQDEIGRSKLGL